MPRCENKDLRNKVWMANGERMCRHCLAMLPLPDPCLLPDCPGLEISGPLRFWAMAKLDRAAIRRRWEWLQRTGYAPAGTTITGKVLSEPNERFLARLDTCDKREGGLGRQARRRQFLQSLGLID